MDIISKDPTVEHNITMVSYYHLFWRRETVEYSVSSSATCSYFLFWPGSHYKHVLIVYQTDHSVCDQVFCLRKSLLKGLQSTNVMFFVSLSKRGTCKFINKTFLEKYFSFQLFCRSSPRQGHFLYHFSSPQIKLPVSKCKHGAKI